MTDQAGNDVCGAGRHFQLADGRNLAPWIGSGDPVHRFDHLCRSDQGVLPPGHGRGSRVIGETLDRDLIAVDANDTFDYADRNIRLIQYAALLDVQFKVTVDRSRRPAR